MIHLKHWLIIHASLYTHSLDEQCSLQESKITLKKKTDIRHEAWEVLIWIVGPRDSQNIQTIAFVFDCPPKVKAKLLWLKTPVIYNTGLRDPLAGNDLNAFSMRTSFHVTWKYHAIFQRSNATKSPTQLWLLWTTTTVRTTWHHNPKDAVVAHIP